jgi:ribosome recycling factor
MVTVYLMSESSQREFSDQLGDKNLVESKGMSITRAQYEPKFDKAVEYYQQEISTLRTGRASVSLLDSVSVDAYGAKMKLNEVASTTVPDPTLIVISPWDKSLLGAIEKGIQNAQLNLSPIVDGQIIRVPVPALTQERRQELVKLLHQKAEGARVIVRNTRIEIKKEIEKQTDQPGVSEDDVAAELKTLEETTKEFIERIDSLTKSKEAELIKI